MNEIATSGREGRGFALLGRIGALAAGATDLEDALEGALGEICAFTGWPIGHVTFVQGGEIVGTAIWHGGDGASFEAFRRASTDLRMLPGEGLPGTVLATGRPAWLLDAALDPSFALRESAAEAGIRSAFAFPLLADGDVSGVLELFTAERIEPDEELLHMTSVIGVELGRMVERARVQTLLRDGEERYRLLFESATDAIFLENPDGRIAAMNAAAEKLTGYSAKELEGQEVTVLLAPEYVDHSRLQLERKLRGDVRETRHETVLVNRHGRRIAVEVSSVLVHRDGVVVGVQAVVRNLDSQRRAELALRESEERFRGAFEAAAIGMALASTDGRWLKVNDALCEIVGYSSDELLTMKYADVTYPDDLDSDIALAGRLLAGEFSSYQMEKRYVRKDGRVIWIHLSVSLVRDADGTPAYSVAQVLEITERKLAELDATVVGARLATIGTLSPRERQVLGLLSEGHTSADAAASLGIGEETVQTHLRRAKAKLSARTRTEAVATALRLGLLNAPAAATA